MKMRLSMIVLISFLASTALAGEVVERIAAIVNGQIILLSDIKRYQLFFEPPEERGSDSKTARLRRLDQLIHHQLLRAEARRFVLEGPSQEEVAARLRSVRQRFKHKRGFQKAMDQTGLQVEKLKEEIREHLWVESLIRERIEAFIFIDPKAVEQYYRKHAEAFDGKKLETVAPDIRKILIDEKEAGKKREYLTRLRSQADIEIRLTTR
ncbi:MAG: hypothetical protein ACE5J1_01235 [Nitrospiria bacterium]